MPAGGGAQSFKPSPWEAEVLRFEASLGCRVSSRAARAIQKNLVPGVEGGEIERLRGGRNSGKMREELFIFLILTVFWVT